MTEIFRLVNLTRWKLQVTLISKFSEQKHEDSLLWVGSPCSPFFNAPETSFCGKIEIAVAVSLVYPAVPTHPVRQTGQARDLQSNLSSMATRPTVDWAGFNPMRFGPGVATIWCCGVNVLVTQSPFCLDILSFVRYSTYSTCINLESISWVKDLHGSKLFRQMRYFSHLQELQQTPSLTNTQIESYMVYWVIITQSTVSVVKRPLCLVLLGSRPPGQLLTRVFVQLPQETDFVHEFLYSYFFL